MNDYDTLKDVLEISELLSNETERQLEVTTVNNKTGKVTTVFFGFNNRKELIEIYTED